jgi:hypothetical protein
MTRIKPPPSKILSHTTYSNGNVLGSHTSGLYSCPKAVPHHYLEGSSDEHLHPSRSRQGSSRQGYRNSKSIWEKTRKKRKEDEKKREKIHVELGCSKPIKISK